VSRLWIGGIASGFGESKGHAGGTGGVKILFHGLVCFVRPVLAGSISGSNSQGNCGCHFKDWPKKSGRVATVDKSLEEVLQVLLLLLYILYQLKETEDHSIDHTFQDARCMC
jgi:hypothetical protein